MNYQAKNQAQEALKRECPLCQGFIYMETWRNKYQKKKWFWKMGDLM